MAENQSSIASLLARLPELQNGKMPPVDAKLTAELTRAVLAGGKDAITALIDSLKAEDDGSDWQSRFLLHALANAVGTPECTAHRPTLAASLLENATGSRPAAVRTFLLTRLRLLATDDAVPRLLPLLTAADAPLADAAAAVLVSIGQGAKNPLAKALESAQGHSKDVIANALAQLTPPRPA